MFQTRKEEGREKKKKAKEKRGEERGGGGLGEREKPRGRVGGWDEREREEKERGSISFSSLSPIQELQEEKSRGALLLGYTKKTSC